MSGLTQRMQQMFSTRDRLHSNTDESNSWDDLLASCAELLNLTASLGIHVVQPLRQSCRHTNRIMEHIDKMDEESSTTMTSIQTTLPDQEP
ncbi:hypothetical protein [Rhodopirellula sp. MGV]|uniref:hypothetical protein n=1 Tax=Rhodopirellula sp. MGV TaxID=2023130 RepID=UPI000B961274|nr:hypothetical protein [Rhodopirellula sp. MGV]OYP39133.1 hypothetical protein CGZ80_00340 [Rhodopirellula sp. MGV]PNY35489.1 hypothetical protein C2E31_18500 [Rhodopirellula baltica]